MTFIAMAVLAASLLLTLGTLRVLAQDTRETLLAAKARAQHDGQTFQRLAFAALWIMIFLLSFL